MFLDVTRKIKLQQTRLYSRKGQAVPLPIDKSDLSFRKSTATYVAKILGSNEKERPIFTEHKRLNTNKVAILIVQQPIFSRTERSKKKLWALSLSGKQTRL